MKTAKKAKTITNKEARVVRMCLGTDDQLIFDIGCETGLRITDILELRAASLGKIMYVKEKKTGKHKIVQISDELYNRLEPIKKAARDDFDIYAFKSIRIEGKHLDRSTYHRHLKQAIEGLYVDCSAHSTRKLYAMNIFEQTGSIEEVQKALNHKYPSTTLTYLGIDLNELVKSKMMT